MTPPDLDALLGQLSFELPPERIAQQGAEPRDHARLLDARGELHHRHIYDLPKLLQPGDLLVFNESKVIPARVMAHKPKTGNGGGGTIEVMLLREERPLVWSAYLKPARRAGNELWLGDFRAEVIGTLDDGARLLQFSEDILPHLDEIGRLPLPPYIAAGDNDDGWRQRYQTVYAKTPGSVAAPTAGLHFTPQLLATLQAGGIGLAHLTLHVGAGTFKPIKGKVSEHVMHAERYSISPEVAAQINAARAKGRVVAVGTTTVRTLESAWNGEQVVAGEGETSIFITPGQAVHVPDLLLTNLHLPDSTLLLLVAALAGVPTIQAAYRAALEHNYRFYSLGDAMLLQNTSR